MLAPKSSPSQLWSGPVLGSGSDDQTSKLYIQRSKRELMNNELLIMLNKSLVTTTSYHNTQAFLYDAGEK